MILDLVSVCFSFLALGESLTVSGTRVDIRQISLPVDCHRVPHQAVPTVRAELDDYAEV